VSNNEGSLDNSLPEPGKYQNTIVYTLLSEESINGPNRYICELHAITKGIDSKLFTGDSIHRSDGCVSHDGNKIVYTKGISPSTKMGAMISSLANDPPRTVLITLDGIAEKAIISSQSQIFVLPRFSPSGNLISVKAIGDSSRELCVFDTSGTKIYSLPLEKDFYPFWISDDYLGYKKENENGQIAVFGIVNISTAQKIEIQLPSIIEGEIKLEDTLLYKFSSGYYVLDYKNSALTKIEKFADLSGMGVIAFKNDSALVILQGKYHALFVSDIAGNLIDSISVSVPPIGLAAVNLWKSCYLIAETGDDQQNIYKISFADRTMEKITANGDNRFIGMVSDNFGF